MMDNTTGGPIGAAQHLRQSVATILTTPIGSRVMRRDFGSLLPALIDQPINQATMAKLVAATVGALMRWEPRLHINRVQFDALPQPGAMRVQITASVLELNTRRPISLAVNIGEAA